MSLTWVGIIEAVFLWKTKNVKVKNKMLVFEILVGISRFFLGICILITSFTFLIWSFELFMGQMKREACLPLSPLGLFFCLLAKGVKNV